MSGGRNAERGMIALRVQDPAARHEEASNSGWRLRDRMRREFYPKTSFRFPLYDALRAACFSRPKAKLSPQRTFPPSNLNPPSATSVRCFPRYASFPPENQAVHPKSFRRPTEACFFVRSRQWIPQSQSRDHRVRILPSIFVLRSIAHRPWGLAVPET